MTPDGVRELERHGIDVLVETGAGEGASITDDDYVAAGADIVPTAADAWAQDMVVKVKEPQATEFDFLRKDLTLVTYLHLAAYPCVAEALLDAQTTSVAYETVQAPDGSLPLLAPMSEVAGRLAPQMGAHYLERHNGGRGVLMGGAPGVRPAKVVVLGAGNVGLEFGVDRCWHGSRSGVGRQEPRPLALRRSDPPRPDRHGGLESRRNRACSCRRRPRDRGGPRGRWSRTGGGERGDGGSDETASGDRRRRRRPGWVHRHHARDHPRRADLREARRRALRSGQHARRGAAHEHLRAHQRHAAVRPRHRAPRCGGRGPPRPGDRARPQHGRRRVRQRDRGSVARRAPPSTAPARPADIHHDTSPTMRHGRCPSHTRCRARSAIDRRSEPDRCRAAVARC